MKKLIVDNVRFYHATNSSSSHSFIIMPKYKHNSTDYSRITDGSNVGEGEYGWDFFTLNDAAEKKSYLATALRSSLKNLLPEEMLDMMTAHFVGVTVDEDSSIDHQSRLDFPYDYHHPNMLDWKFFAAFREWALQPNVWILGGNDNSDEEHENDDGHGFQFPFTESYGVMVARFDPVYKSWTLYNKASGFKVRFRFADDRTEEQSEEQYRSDLPSYMTDGTDKAFFAELIDMKITDACPFDCRFCYMASTPNGKAAAEGDIYDYFTALSELRVFEVAIGGGEPTLHPKFVNILEDAKEKGITVSFTTRNMAWLRDSTKWIPIMNAAAGFAFSVHRAEDIAKLQALLTVNQIDLDRVNLHIVMGTIMRGEFEHILREAAKYGFRVTLLGFKDVGFGANYQKKDYGWWMESVQELNDRHECPAISIDTTLAAESKDLLESSGVSKLLYYTKDGKFSAYIDAVNKKFAASSYDAAAVSFDIPDKLWGDKQVEWFIEAFAKFE